MKTNWQSGLSMIALCFAVAKAAETAVVVVNPPSTQVGVVIKPSPTVERHITIQLGDGQVVYDAPSPHEVPITVAPGTHVKITPNARASEAVSFRWFRGSQNGTLELSERNSVLDIAAATGADTAFYYCIFKLPTGKEESTGAVSLLVARRSGPSVSNFSSLIELSPSQPSATYGFFVDAGIGTALVLVRAIGPGLAKFGVRNVAVQPKVEVLDKFRQRVARGTEMQYRLYHAQVVAAMEQEVGAIPRELGDDGDVYELGAGPYTVLLSAPSGAMGTVLLEVYQTPF